MKAPMKFMNNRFVLCCLILMCPFIFLGCATKAPVEDSISKQERYAQYFQEHHKAILVPTAESALGTKYKFGGTSEQGFDCSGFVKWVYSHAGVNLPRTAREQSRLGELVKKESDMQVGDIVAFYHPRRGYHTGIYLGEGKFVHSPRRRKSVRVSELSTSYFSKNFLGARRVVENIKEAEMGAAQELLEKYELKSKAQAKAKSKSKKSKKS